MNKIELMAMSLPYGLKFMPTEYNMSVNKMYGVQTIHNSDEYQINGFTSKWVKPILHPISYITKEIEHNGEKFVPIVELAKLFSPYKEKAVDYEVVTMFTEPTAKILFDEKIKCRYMYYSLPCTYNIERYTFGVIQKLIKWHFDIYNLIEKGEAIDINSLEINPYK